MGATGGSEGLEGHLKKHSAGRCLTNTAGTEQKGVIRAPELGSDDLALTNLISPGRVTSLQIAGCDSCHLSQVQLGHCLSCVTKVPCALPIQEPEDVSSSVGQQPGG